ncbi:FAD-dependent oxidoreductase [Arthrobacter psychrochitiniphilus]|uniref:FAD-dependent oxidoreductase n=1 Tax=Arthrobacter psychrochitiniphilus TaxID=291045 RepID=UPI0017A96B80|nr:MULTISPECIES: FAD-dependent oxidoreductase [Arthrobacter]NYG17199.1 ferredoxin-NADP reductase [Arthrobacter psychrochitiniphilus]
MKKEKAAEGTMLFQFEKPEGFTYTAGQFADYTLLEPSETDAEANTRGFTLASAPYEPNLMCTTRMRDTAFKRVLKNMPLGTDVELDAPYGSFTLHSKLDRPAVFLTGGIENHACAQHHLAIGPRQDWAHDYVVLLQQASRGCSIPGRAEPCGRCRSQRHRRAHYDGAGKSRHGWTGETGYVDAAMLARHIQDLSAPIYYLCGPARMVTAMRSLLNGAGVDDDDIRTEEFTGY